MQFDILGNPISKPKPPHNGICPNCGGIIKPDVVVGWLCHDCESEFDDEELTHFGNDI